MINSSAFNYINVLGKSADGSWLRQSAITNNTANVDTPGYKRQEVDFEGLLKTELGRSKYTSLDQKVKDIHLNHLNARTYRDSTNFSYRLDENNVDIDTEEVELASEQLRYQGLTSSITHEMTRLKSVMG